MLENGELDVSDAKANKNLDVTVLAKSSAKAWTESDNIMLNPVILATSSDTDFKQYDLAVILEGKFTSAFDKAPKKTIWDEDGNEVEYDENDGDFTAANHIASSKLPGKVFVIGTSQITTSQIIDASSRSPVAMFMKNVVDYMNGNEELCKMRTKGITWNVLSVDNLALGIALQYLCFFGPVVLVVIVGLVALRLRAKHRETIRRKFNPDDEREIVKAKKEDK